jgi:hypothetical protein
MAGDGNSDRAIIARDDEPPPIVVERVLQRRQARMRQRPKRRDLPDPGVSLRGVSA